jgi:hypothetical protein
MCPASILGSHARWRLKQMQMDYDPAAWHEKKIFPKGDFLKLMPIFSINNFVNPFEGCSLISCSASVRQGFRNFTSELAYPNPEEFLQFLS